MRPRPILSPILTEGDWRSSRVVGWVTATLLVTSAGSALGQPTVSDNLFQDGKALMEQGRVPEACQKFAVSLALARRGGTLLNLALCRAKEGKNATAMRLLAEARDVATRDGRADRALLAAESLEAVRARLSWLTLRPAAGAETPGLTLFCDGETLSPGAWGTVRALSEPEGSNTTTRRSVYGVAAAPDGDVVLVGDGGYAVSLVVFDPAHPTTSARAGVGTTDFMIARYSGSGELVWASLFGDSAHGNSVAIAPTGAIWATGYFDGNLDLGVPPIQVSHGGNDIFLARFAP